MDILRVQFDFQMFREGRIGKYLLCENVSVLFPSSPTLKVCSFLGTILHLLLPPYLEIILSPISFFANGRI